MTCRELAEFLEDYRTGGLEREVREVFEGHLAACPECVAYMESYEATVGMCRKAYGQTAEPVQNRPGKVPEALIRAILDARSRA